MREPAMATPDEWPSRAHLRYAQTEPGLQAGWCFFHARDRHYFAAAGLTNRRADFPDSICPEKNREIAGRSARKVNCCGPLVGVMSLR